MFSPTFDWVFAAILAVLAVVFFMGKGGGVLRAFAGKSNDMLVKRKRTPEEERQYQRAFGWCLLVMAASEVMMALLAPYYLWVPIASIVIIVVDLIALVRYLRKNFPE
jgi:4-hydroxybenzoate polyprenyltransferase